MGAGAVAVNETVTYFIVTNVLSAARKVAFRPESVIGLGNGLFAAGSVAMYNTLKTHPYCQK